MSELKIPRTSLRKRFEYSRALDPEAQMRECVEYLENPEILVAEFCDSFLTAEAFDNRQEDFCSYGQTQIPKRRWVDRVIQRVIDHEHIQVLLKPPYQFRYVAREIVPLWSSSLSPEDGADRRRGDGGLDSVGAIEEQPDQPQPVLGVVVPKEDATPYLSLLRVLTCLAEVSTAPQMERAGRFLFKGRLPELPTFDLHQIVVDPEPCDAPAALVQLTRDLADQFNARLKEEWEFPDLLRNIVCATLPSSGFDGCFGIDWCV